MSKDAVNNQDTLKAERECLHSGTVEATVVATNVIAGSVLESLKAGLVLKGTVRSYDSPNGSIGTAWIAVDLPGVGSREVAVHCEHNPAAESKLRPGKEVELQCVPNALNPGRFMFRIL